MFLGNPMINSINPAFGDGFFPFLNGCHCSRTRGSAVAARCTHQALAAMADLPKLQQNYNKTTTTSNNIHGFFNIIKYELDWVSILSIFSYIILIIEKLPSLSPAARQGQHDVAGLAASGEQDAFAPPEMQEMNGDDGNHGKGKKRSMAVLIIGDDWRWLEIMWILSPISLMKVMGMNHIPG